MKKLAFIVSVSLLIGCGGGGGGGDGTPHAPLISNLYYSRNEVVAGTGSGSVAINASLDFSDNGGDLALVRTSAYDNTGALLWSRSEPIEGVSGDTSGTIEGVLILTTTDPGVFTFRIQVEDAAGNSSNVLEGTFKVIDAQFAPLAIATPLADSVAGDGSRYYSTDVIQGTRYTVAITGLSGPANLSVFNDNTLQSFVFCSSGRECSTIAEGDRLYSKVDRGSSAEPVSYTIFAAPNPLLTNPISEGSRESPVGIPRGIPTQGQVATRGDSFYSAIGLTPGQSYTVSIIGLSGAADLHVYPDNTYSLELDCTLRYQLNECTTTTGGTLYFSVGAGALNREGAGYLIFVE